MRTRPSLALLGTAIFIFAACLLVVYHAARAKNHPAALIANHAAQSSAAPQQSDPSTDTKLISLYFAEDPEVVPPFAARDLSGQLVSTGAMKGKVVIVNFWATWCGPCREEIPEMIALQSQYKDELQIIGVSEDDGPPAQVAKFVQKVGINYPVVMSTDALEKEYGGIPALPTSFLVNKDGRVVQKDVGLYPEDYYNMQVRVLLGLPVNAHIKTFKDTGQIFLKNADRASELPGVSFAGLTPAQQKIALHRLNATNCTCGCGLTLAQCRINDTSCPISGSMAMKIVHSIAHASTGAAAGNSKSGSTR
jgi:thiol-disulfide isomerase/thioredoxin